MRHCILALLILSGCATPRQIYLLTDTHQVSLGQGSGAFASFAMRACPSLGTPYRVGVVLEVGMDAYIWGCETRGVDYGADAKIEAAQQGWQYHARPGGWALLATGRVDRDTAVHYFGIFVTQACQDTVGKVTAISATVEDGAYAATCTALDIGTRGRIADRLSQGEQIEVIGEVPR